MNRWDRAFRGESQAVLIAGEAGIGKSRLMQHFHEQIAETPHAWVEAASAPFFKNTPYYPVTQILHGLMASRANQSADEQLTLLESSLEKVGLRSAEATALIAAVLNVALPPRYATLFLPAEQQRHRLLAAIVRWVIGAARAQPLVMATEDMHWADASTLELIKLLVEQQTPARLLLLYTARPEFRAEWTPPAHHTQITLNRLSTHNVRTIVAQGAGKRFWPRRPLPRSSKGRGHPTFCGRVDTSITRQWRYEIHGARDSGNVARLIAGPPG